MKPFSPIARGKLSLTGLLLLAGFLCPLLGGCTGIQTRSDNDAGNGKESSCDFTLRSLDGSKFHLRDMREKVVYISFWATWCEPCRIELPLLQKIWKRYRDRGFELVTISVDPADLENDVRQQVRRQRYEFPVLLDQETEISNRYNPTMDLPFGMILDGKGKIVSMHQGFRIGDEEKIEKEIKELLKK